MEQKPSGKKGLKKLKGDIIADALCLRKTNDPEYMDMGKIWVTITAPEPAG